MLQYFLYKLGLFVINGVPRQWAYAFSSWVAERRYFFAKEDRESVIRNLRQITGSDQGCEDLARQVFHNFGRYLVDFFLMYRTVNPQFIRDHVTIDGEANLNQAIARGKGIIVLTAHIGNWEMGAALMAQLGHPMLAIALPHKERRVNELFNRQRQNYGVTVVPMNIAIRKCIEALHKNKVVAMLGDRDFGAFGEPVPFLGRVTSIPKGAAAFALKTGATILPAFVVADGHGNFKMIFDAPIVPPESKKRDDQVLIDLVKAYVVAIEKVIRAYPAQWMMFRDYGVDYEDRHIDSRLQRIRKAWIARRNHLRQRTRRSGG